jgi:large subunit ribosomal protein L22
VAARATTKDTGISVRKLKPILDLVRGRRVEEAVDMLRFFPSPAAAKVASLIGSATANAESEQLMRGSELRIVQIYANEGARTKRFRANSKGRAGRIRRRNSHITVVVDEEAEGIGQ